MTLKPMTSDEFYRAYGRPAKRHRVGVKQAVVLEFLESGADVAEVENFSQKPDSFQVGIIGAVKSLKANVRCVIRKGHLFLIRLPAE